MVHRITKPRATILSLSLFPLLSSAIVLPQSIPDPATRHSSSSLWTAGVSSSRKSINFGPDVPSVHHSLADPSTKQQLWNEVYAALPISAVDQLAGDQVAKAFVDTLHPGSSFRLVDGYRSSHTNVFHAHFLQVIDGVDVANGNLNVNINLSTREVVSYGDSSYAKSSSDVASIDPKTWKDKVASWAGGARSELNQVTGQAAQVVFGDNAPQPKEKEDDIIETYSSPPFNPDAATGVESLTFSDPRHGLLTFLSLQSTSSSSSIYSLPRSTLISQLTINDTGSHTTISGNLPDLITPVKASLAYIHDGQGKLTLTWKYIIETEDNMYEAYVDASPSIEHGSENTLLVVDWVRDFRPTGGEMGFEALAGGGGGMNVQTKGFRKMGKGARELMKAKLGIKREEEVKQGSLHEGYVTELASNISASYNVFPWGVNAPDVGSRKLLKGDSIGASDLASPAGWHTVPSSSSSSADKIYLDTRGNNVFAQDNVDGGNSMNGYRPGGGKDHTFDFKLGWPKSGTPLEPSTYINASVTQLFYTNSMIHDLFYHYGFDEASGNFQEYNFGKGGLGGDAVQANAQDGSGYNNANFATPPDGSRPRMRMYSWTGSQPYRDGDFEAGIVIHEYSHGISTRLTGGPANSQCLGWGEAGGMGEGWGDFFATAIRNQNPNETEFSMGEWASSRVGGIRNYVYSTNLTVNPSTYKTLDKPGYYGVHAIGEVWAVFLWDLHQLLVAKYGFAETLFPPSSSNSTTSEFYSTAYKNPNVPAKGNTLAVQLVVDALKIQPCRPSFQKARDAIVTADQVLTGGDNFCEIWHAFTRRGLGPKAEVVGATPWGGGIRTEDYVAPKACAGKKYAF